MCQEYAHTQEFGLSRGCTRLAMLQIKFAAFSHLQTIVVSVLVLHACCRPDRAVTT